MSGPRIGQCNSLNRLGPESGIIMNYGLIGIGVALEEVCHCGDEL